jgi:hypothetical protein
VSIGNGMTDAMSANVNQANEQALAVNGLKGPASLDTKDFALIIDGNRHSCSFLCPCTTSTQQVMLTSSHATDWKFGI